MIVQRLGEIDEPLRVIDLAEQLRILSTTVTRCAVRLEEKSLVQRLSSPHDKKAVYLRLTEAGKESAVRIQTELDTLGNNHYWGLLSKDDLEVTNKIRGLFLEALVRQEEESHKKLLDDLRIV